MKVLLKWEKCCRFNDHSDAYYLEVHKDELNEKITSLIEKEYDDLIIDQRYFNSVNHYAKINKGLVTKDCAYLLVNIEVTKAFLCPDYYPYSSLFSGQNPFRRIVKTRKREFPGYYIKNAIEIMDIDELRRIDKIIKEKGYFVFKET